MENDSGLYTFPRAQIITLLKEYPKGLAKEKISDITKINRTSVLHHLKILEERGLVKFSKRQKGEGNRGAPIVVTITDKADPQTKAVLGMFEKIASVFKK